jgi:hypothetical protein
MAKNSRGSRTYARVFTCGAFVHRLPIPLRGLRDLRAMLALRVVLAPDTTLLPIESLTLFAR